jgi:hypothetical protein
MTQLDTPRRRQHRAPARLSLPTLASIRGFAVASARRSPAPTCTGPVPFFRIVMPPMPASSGLGAHLAVGEEGVEPVPSRRFTYSKAGPYCWTNCQTTGEKHPLFRCLWDWRQGQGHCVHGGFPVPAHMLQTVDLHS